MRVCVCVRTRALLGAASISVNYRVMAQPDKSQEVEDLGLTFFAQRAPQLSQVKEAWGQTLEPPPSTSGPLLALVTTFPALPSAFLSCLTPVLYLWR